MLLLLLPCVAVLSFSFPTNNNNPMISAPFRLSETGHFFGFFFFRRDTHVCIYTHINVYVCIVIKFKPAREEKGRHGSQTVGDVCDSQTGENIFFSDGKKKMKKRKISSDCVGPIRLNFFPMTLIRNCEMNFQFNGNC